MEHLFTETFFRRNDYFKTALKWNKQRFDSLLPIIQNWQKYCKNYDREFDKETTDESEFVDVVFKKILGYMGKGESSDSYHLYSKFPIPGAGSSGAAGSADLALGYFEKKRALAQVLVEFKDPGSSDLDKPSPRKDHLSPTNQCWNYLDSYPDARWGIITNFNEIRIYYKAKGKQKRETFYFIVPPGLRGKVNPLSEETELLKFISIFRRENLLSQSGKSFVEDILDKQGHEEVRVEKAFYTKYKTLREKAFWEILKVSPQYQNQKSRLLRLVQKLLDRVIFCWFCEDSREGLLPNAVLSQMIEEITKTSYYNASANDLWARVRSLFETINIGGNFNITVGYNGGLFKEDKELDALRIPNFIFKEIGEIGSEYDFGNENELNVNILGHIFEKSISDLEEMRKSFLEKQAEELEGPQSELDLDVAQEVQSKADKTEKSKAKRKKDGVYYTPEHITNYIVEQSVGKWLEERFTKIDNRVSKQKTDRDRSVLVEYRDEVLKKIRILDPACGSGAFLIAAFNFLWRQHELVASALQDQETSKGFLPLNVDDVEKTILENNLFGVDINDESVEITKLSLWLKTASKNKKLNNLDSNIKVGNSLISDKSIAGGRAFNWEKEFSNIVKFNNGELIDGHGFDCVIGNPPYDVLSEKETGRKVEHEIEYFKAHPVLSHAIRGKSNLYKLFICRGLSLTKANGKFSYIVPLPLVGDDQAASVRKYLFENSDFVQIDCFPQKDNANERVFEDAKYSTCVFVIDKVKENRKFLVRTHPGKSFVTPWENGIRLSGTEVKKFDPESLSIPFCSGAEWSIIKQIAGRKDFVRLGEFVTSFQGEVNETTAKKFLTKKSGYPKIIRGANVTLYCVREASQGEEFFLDDVGFLRGKSSDSKAVDFRKNRIGFQRSAPQDNFRRIIAAPIPKNVFCFDTVSYITDESSQLDLDVLLVMLNSKLWDWWFRARSTNSKVNEYQFNGLPMVRFRKSESMNEEIKKMLIEQRYPELINLLESDGKSEKVPDWATLLLRNLSKKVQLTEGQRFISSKRERAHLAQDSEIFQRYIDQTIYAIFGIGKEQADQIEATF